MAKYYGIKGLVNLFVQLAKPFTDAYKVEFNTKPEPQPESLKVEAPQVQPKAEAPKLLPRVSLPVIPAPVFLALGLIERPQAPKIEAKPAPKKAAPKKPKAPKAKKPAPKKAAPKVAPMPTSFTERLQGEQLFRKSKRGDRYEPAKGDEPSGTQLYRKVGRKYEATRQI